MFSNLSIDPVTAFGMRPPELRFVRHIKMYYKWFYFKNSNMHRNTFSKQVCNLKNNKTKFLLKQCGLMAVADMCILDQLQSQMC